MKYSALDQMNTRRYLLLIQKELGKYIGEMNNDQLRNEVTDALTKLLPTNEHSVKCDIENNPSTIIENNQLVAEIKDPDDKLIYKFTLYP